MRFMTTKPGVTAWLGGGALAGLLMIGVPKTIEAQDTSAVRQDTSQTATAADTIKGDTTQRARAADEEAEVQNPPGYRGMERPVGVFPPDTADTSSASDATSRVEQLQRQDSLAAQDTTSATEKNPPGYRGMERPVDTEITRDQQAKWQTLLEAARKQPNPTPELRDAINNLGKQSPGAEAQPTKKADTKKKAKTTKKQKTEQSSRTDRDSASTVRVGQDTTGDTTRYEVNAQEGRSATDTTGQASSDTSEIIHRERETAPGVGYDPPPYPRDSEQVWVEQQPSGDSVAVGFDSTAKSD